MQKLIVTGTAVALLACAVAAQQQDRPQRGRQGSPAVITVLDADGNGELSEKEIATASEALKQLDKNGDGKVAREELFSRSPAPARGGSGTATTSEWPTPKDETEKDILEVIKDMDKNQRRGMMNVSVKDGRLLRLLTESLVAKHVVEIGTSNGFSAHWFCLALRTTGGKLTTYEIDAGRAKRARENFKRSGVEELVTLIEGDAHEEIVKLGGPIDILFLDADKEGYTDYLKKLLPKMRPGGLILAHNVRSHGGSLQDYLETLAKDSNLETLFLLMDGAGISATLIKR